jgi:hypothetical protein
VRGIMAEAAGGALGPDMTRALLTAIIEDDEVAVRQWLVRGGDPNMTAMTFASPDVAQTDVTLPALAVARGMHMSEIDDDRGYPALRALLEHGADPKFLFNDTSIVRVAVRQGLCRLVALLFEFGAELEDKNDEYMSTLDLAVCYDHMDTFALLLRHATREQMKITARVIIDDHQEALAMLLHAGVDPNTPVETPASSGMTPLLLASLMCDSVDRRGTMRMLLSAGARPDYQFHGASAEDRTENETYLRLLADVRLSGGWKAYARAPRVDLLMLRVLCQRGRATAPRGPLRRLFSTSFANSGAKRQARSALLPDALFWHVLSFWRSQRQVDGVR